VTSSAIRASTTSRFFIIKNLRCHESASTLARDDVALITQWSLAARRRSGSPPVRGAEGGEVRDAAVLRRPDSTFALAEVSLTPGAGNGDYIIAAGDISGRKLTLAAQETTGVANGTATHFAIVNTGASELLLVNVMTNVAISSGEPQATNAVRLVEVEDPA
jgi:hypothetical protein